jgi:hypothetical protein
MYTGSLKPVSNREDWIEAFTLVDAETGDVIDITGCDVTVTVRDFASKCTVLTGSTDGGEITLPEDGTFMWTFPAASMSGLCQRQYEVGVRIARDTRTAQLIVGTVEIIEGIDRQ